MLISAFLTESMQNSFFIQKMYPEHLLCSKFCAGLGAAAIDNKNTVVSSWGLVGRMQERNYEFIT